MRVKVCDEGQGMWWWSRYVMRVKVCGEGQGTCM